MSLPRFLDRVVDATSPLLNGLDRDAVRTKLEHSSVALVAGGDTTDGPGQAGFLLTANLAARLYPRIRLEGPAELLRRAKDEIILVNPAAAVLTGSEQTTATLGYETPVDKASAVSVFARGWNIYVDVTPEGDDPSPPAGPAALAAAAMGIGELFRIVFADELGPSGRRGPQGGAFNLVTLGEPTVAPAVPDRVELGEFRLVGAGAIGQAAAHTLAVAGVRGTMLTIDREKVTLSNLQRYVLTHDADIGAVKVDLLFERLKKANLEVVPVPAEWHAGLVEGQLPTLVAVDSPEARIAVQASLPGPIYNAWTQPADIGWSRHESFGEEPCLACLYWPEHPRPSRHEQIAAAFGQHPLRVLAYLLHRLPVGLPLPAGGIPAVPGLEPPPEAESWLTNALVDDIAATAGVDGGELAAWRDRHLTDLYQEGICGGGLLHLNVGEAPGEVLVPLAHQSALAGILLATEFLVGQVPKLKGARPAAVEGRYDVLAGLPQVFARPRRRTPSCLCADAVFLDVYRRRFGGNGTAASITERAGGAEVT